MVNSEKSNITVAIRIRPLIEKEVKLGESNIIRTNKNTIIVGKNILAS